MKKYCFIICVLLFLGIGKADAQYKVLHYFNGINGCQPSAGSPTLLGKTLYGMTETGGTNGDGCIFSIDTDGSGYKEIFDFNGSNGKGPGGALTYSGGKFYGIASNGGANNDGCIFSIDTNGSGYKDLFDFGGTIIEYPQGSLALSGGKLYGMTPEGGSSNNGNIFSIDTDGSGYKEMYDFDGSVGCESEGSLMLSGSKLYGMTSQCAANHYGCIFSIDTNGNGCTDMYDFTGPSGPPYQIWTNGSLTLSGNKLYGSIGVGGIYDYGYIFHIDTNGVGFKAIFDYPTIDAPIGDLTLSESRIYAMGEYGQYDVGSIFSIDTNGSGYEDMYDFNHDSTGYSPYGSLTLVANMLYGMAPAYKTGGNVGVIFKIDTDAVSTASINNIQGSSKSITVYPNPCNGIFTISLSRAKLVSASETIEVYNVLGMQVYNAILKQVQGDNRINVSAQANGVYLYRVISENGNLFGEGKLVIQK